MELQDYLRIVRAKWILITAVTLITIGLTAVWSLIQTPVYRASTEVYVSVRIGDGTIGELQQGTNFIRQAVGSYADIINTSIIMEPVAQRLDTDLSATQLASKVSASSPSNTVLINISASDSSPEFAAELANVTASVFAEVVSNQLERPAEGAPARVQIDTVQPAVVPSAPISPNAQRNLSLGLLLGLLMGVGIAVLRETMDTRIRGRAQVTQITNTPILGGIMYDPDATGHPLVVLNNPTSPRSEAYRAFRTNLQFLKVEGNPRSFVVTSSGPSEGKSVTAANLAVSLAEAGSTVCIVDGDLRKPRIAELFGIEGGVDLTDVLIGRSDLAHALQKWGIPNLYVLPSGHRPPNPSEMLGSHEMADLLTELQQEFDYVIVDAPPVLVVTDAAIIAKHVGGALMVAAVGKTRKDGLKDALQSMDRIEARVLGIILTMVPPKGPDSYGYSAYTYGEVHEISKNQAATTPSLTSGSETIVASGQRTRSRTETLTTD